MGNGRHALGDTHWVTPGGGIVQRRTASRSRTSRADGIFPALTMGKGTIEYNFGEKAFKFAPPWDTK